MYLGSLEVLCEMTCLEHTQYLNVFVTPKLYLKPFRQPCPALFPLYLLSNRLEKSYCL